MRSSRSKKKDLSNPDAQDVSDRRIGDAGPIKNNNSFSSFFTRAKRINTALATMESVPSIENGGGSPQSSNRRSSLGSIRYKMMSRSMNDLGSMLSRSDTMESSQRSVTGLQLLESTEPSPEPSVVQGQSPKKKSPAKKQPVLPFPEEVVIKQGWLNKKVNKKEQIMKLYRVYV